MNNDDVCTCETPFPSSGGPLAVCRLCSKATRSHLELASHPGTSPDDLGKLSFSEDPEVLAAVLENPATPAWAIFRARDRIERRSSGHSEASEMVSPPAGWYPDPAGLPCDRYWDGAEWTERTRPQPGGHASRASQSEAPQQTSIDASMAGPATLRGSSITYCTSCGAEGVGAFCARCGAAQVSSGLHGGERTLDSGKVSSTLAVMGTEPSSTIVCDPCGAYVIRPNDRKNVRCWNCSVVLDEEPCPACDAGNQFWFKPPYAAGRRLKCSSCRKSYTVSRQQLKESDERAKVTQSTFRLACQQCESQGGCRITWKSQVRPGRLVPIVGAFVAAEGSFLFWKEAICTACGGSWRMTVPVAGQFRPNS